MLKQDFHERDDNRYVVRLRGLPWSATDDEIVDFLEANVVAGEESIRRTFIKEGRPSGEAYVEMLTKEDMNIALKKDRANMGKRYIEVFVSSIKEMEYVLNRSGGMQSSESRNECMVRLRGLPYQCTKEEISQFFAGLDIVPNGINLPMDSQGRSSGEAYVEFATQDGAEKALEKHKDKIGHRYIEIFKSTKNEAHDYGYGSGYGNAGNRNFGRGNRPGPYDRPMRGIRMRGSGGRGRGGGRMMGDNYGQSYGGEEEEYWEDNEDESYGWGGNESYGNKERYGGGRGNMRSQGYGRGGRSNDNNWYGNRNYANDDYEEDYYEEDSGMGSDYVVHMRGLPFKATDDDISAFFSPIVPVRIHIEYGRDGRVSGEANVEFASYQDAQAAMQKNKESMQHRYIELFYRGGHKSGRGGMRGGRGHIRGRGMMQQRGGRDKRGGGGYRF